MTRGVKSIWPFAASVAIYLVTVAALLGVALRFTEGQFVYGLDDAYTHMAVANNLATTGTWGINPHEFAGVSSSPLWTALLAILFRTFGRHEIIPLVLNLAAGAGVLFITWRFAAQFVTSARAIFLLLLAQIFFACLPTLCIGGMENTLQIALCLAMIALAVREEPKAVGLCALGFLVVAIRFEGLFLIAATCLFLLFRRRVRLAFILGAAGILPVAIYAAYAARHGGTWLPNSVLLKGLLGGDGFLKIRPGKYVVALMVPALVALAAMWRRSDSTGRVLRGGLAVFLLTAMLHLHFASFGFLYRYEAYLIAIGVLALPLALAHLEGKHRRLALIASIPAALLLSYRAGEALYRAPLASDNIHDQQLQMARFVHDYFPGSAVAVNDIGAVSCFGNARVIDLWGLANADVFRRRWNRTYDSTAIEEICRKNQAKLAMIYPEWFDRFGGVPASWRKLEGWTIRHNVVCDRDTVWIYATTPDAVAEISRALDDFAPRLPGDVTRRSAHE